MAKLKTYLYDCDQGQGRVEALALWRARLQAVREAGTNNNVRNVRLAKPEDLSFRQAMGGN